MTKIVDTLGPKSRSVEVTSACLKARMPENLTTLAGSLFTLHASQIHVDLPTLSDKDNEMLINCHLLDSMTTRVVDSMTDNLRPTRAEATNVANAILDGSDAILLGAETLCGLYPVETISTIGKICAEVEKVFNQDLYFKKTVKYVGEPMIHLESIASSEVIFQYIVPFLTVSFVFITRVLFSKKKRGYSMIQGKTISY
ncbi:hypothetical protein JHK85_012806 [Glycine max]|nr:hypothetical protein JHK85_012806 [Glycine max]